MSLQWYYARDGRTLGPVSAETLQQLSRQADLLSTDLVWRDGMPDWVPASSIGLGSSAIANSPPEIGLQNARHNTPPSIPVPLPPPVIGTNRVARRPPSNRLRAALILCLAIVAIGIGSLFVMRSRQSVRADLDRAGKKLEPSQQDRQETRIESQVGLVTADPTKVAKSPKSAAEVPFQQKVPPVEIPEAAKTPEIAPATIIGDIPSAKPNSTEPRSADVAEPKSQLQPPPPPTSTPPNKQAGRTLFQQVEIVRNPRFSIQGLETAQNIRYVLLSRLDIAPPADGRRKVVQFIQDTKLLAADDLSRDTFAKSLERLKKQQYTYTLNNRGEVIEFTGHKDNLKALPIELSAAAGFAVTSVIDEDGWKELAELTFLVPDPQSSANQSWRRQMTHNWGSLGAWAGMTTFTRRGKKKGIQEIEYKHEMKYTKPAGPVSGLPFKVTDARFEPQRAGGKVEFDIERQQVKLAQEVFEVRGVVVVELLGQSLEIQLAEQQLIEIRILDQSPGAQQ
jgi:hypothetical protein